MEASTDSVSAIGPHYTVAFPMRIIGYRNADVSDSSVRLNGRNATLQAFPSCLEEESRGFVDFAYGYCLGAITVQTVQEESDVNVYNVAIPERSVVWNSVADDFVDGCAHTLGKSVIIEWTGISTLGNACFVNYGIDLVGCDARTHGFDSCLKDTAGCPTGFPHLLQFVPT